MRKYLGIIVAIVALAAFASVAGTAGTDVAQATPPASQCGNGETFNPNAGECQPNGTQVTICHVAGLAEDPANTVTLTIALVAAVGPAGHFNENGTTQAGHEQDYWGACEVVTPPEEVEVCDPESGEIISVPEDEADNYLPADDEACQDVEQPPTCEEDPTQEGCEEPPVTVPPTCVTKRAIYDRAGHLVGYITINHCKEPPVKEPKEPKERTPDAPPILTGGTVPHTL